MVTIIDVSVIGLSETRDHTIVNIFPQSCEFTGVDFAIVYGDCHGQTCTIQLCTCLTS